MKKIIALSALMIMFASSAFAGLVTINAGGAIKGTNSTTSTDASLGKLSTNVDLTVFADTNAFASTTKHLSGSRGFGTSSTDTRIYYIESEAGKKASDAFTLTKSDSSDFTTANKWSSL